MFKVGDYVVKNNYGVCEIVGEEEKQIAPGMPKEKYFLLKSVDGKLTVYQPVKSAEKLLSPVMDKTEAGKFILELAGFKYAWNNDDKTRVIELKKRVETNPTIEVLGVTIGGYYNRISEGKQISRADKNFLESLEEKLFPVLGFSLDCDNNAVKDRFDQAFNIQREGQI